MPRKIFKYRVSVDKTTAVSLPETATIRHFSFQGDDLYVWIEAEQGCDCVDWHFSVYGTGWTIDNDCQQWCGTTMTSNQAFVWHLFYEVKKNK